jgi:electron transfer flavoprotein alpha subunit
VLYIDDPALAEFTSDAYQKTLANLISSEEPRAILFGNTSIGADVANAISIHLDLPLVSSCVSFSTDGKFVSQICGGKIMAEGDLPGSTAVVTMIPGGHKPEDGQGQQPPAITTIDPPDLDNLRVKLKRYIEPEAGDVDISREPILIAVGRGIQTEDNIELAEELAGLIDGTVCASRPIVDQGWLAISRMVGKSGKSVKPKLYLALGISGAPEHVEGMSESETIIAVNTDPAAPIFDIAKYGAEIDLLDLLEVLIEQLEDI